MTRLINARKNYREASRLLRRWRRYGYPPAEVLAYREDCVKVALDRLWAAQQDDLAFQLSTATRRAFMPKVFVQLWKSTPLMQRLRHDAGAA